MNSARLKRYAQRALSHFPERHIAVHSHGEVREWVLTTQRQLILAGVAAAGILWLTLSTIAGVSGLVVDYNSASSMAQTRARYEGWIADRQARLNSAMAQLNATSHAGDQLASTLERRQAALAVMMAGLQASTADQPGASANTPLPVQIAAGTPSQRLAQARMGQEQLIEAAGAFAKNRADRLRMAFRLAGLDPSLYAGQGDALGGPLIDAKDPRALAAVLDVDAGFARRIQRVSLDLSDAKGLATASQSLPLALPADQVSDSSGFGARIDPFTGQPAFHPGQDFAGPLMTPVHATAPGVISFAGLRSGYGNTVEIDHGRGFKTRYAHLEVISVAVGQHVALGQRIGGMGSTGRSTGSHLHYEVWVNGRPQNPLRFVKAGDYVQQAQ